TPPSCRPPGPMLGQCGRLAGGSPGAVAESIGVIDDAGGAVELERVQSGSAAIPGAGGPAPEEPGQALLGCPVCGQSLPRPGPCPNWWCRRSDRAFSVAFAVGVHDGALRHAVLRYKYRRELWWAGVFARLFADHLRRNATW